MKDVDLHRNIVAQPAGTSQTNASYFRHVNYELAVSSACSERKREPLQFYATHDIIKKVSPEARLASHRIEALCASLAFSIPTMYREKVASSSSGVLLFCD